MPRSVGNAGLEHYCASSPRPEVLAIGRTSRLERTCIPPERYRIAPGVSTWARLDAVTAGLLLVVAVLVACAALAVIVGNDARRRGQWWWWLWAAFVFLVPLTGIIYLVLRNRVPWLRDMTGSRPPWNRMWGR